MRHTALIIVVAVLLTACVSESTATSTAIPPTDTPSPTYTYTPDPTPTPTSTPTPLPTPTATETSPPLPNGALLVQKEGSFWTAYDDDGEQIAMWLPDPDTQELGWRQQYVKNDRGNVLSWDAENSEWDNVPQPDGEVSGWIDLEGEGVVPVWKMDVSALERQDDVVVGEYKDGKWEIVPFEVMLPDDIIENIRTTPPYSYGEDSHRNNNQSLVYFQYNNQTLLGLKLEKNSAEENEVHALVGGFRGIAQVELDYFAFLYPEKEWPDNQEIIFIPEMNFEDLSMSISKFTVMSKAENFKEGKREGGITTLMFLSVVNGANIREGGCFAYPEQDFHSGCVEIMQGREIDRPYSADDLAAKVQGYWKSPRGGVNWWEQAPKMPDNYIKRLAFTDLD